MQTFVFILLTFALLIVAQQFKLTQTTPSSETKTHKQLESDANKQQNFLNFTDTSKEHIFRLAKIRSTGGRLERFSVDLCFDSCEICMQKSLHIWSTRIATMVFTVFEGIRSVQIELKRIKLQKFGKKSQNTSLELLQFRFRTETIENDERNEANSSDDPNSSRWGWAVKKEFVPRCEIGENSAIGCVMIEVQTTWADNIEVEPILFELKNDLQAVILQVDFEGWQQKFIF